MRALAGQDAQLVMYYRNAYPELCVAPFRRELVERARLHDRPGQRMRTDGRALLEHADVEVRLQLLQANRAGETRGTRADDQEVVFHHVALDRFV